jgi:glucose/arabinose dehydrogenase
MEAYEATLSDPEIWGLVVLLREFQHDAMRGQYGGPTATNGVYSSKHHRYRLETVVDRGGELRTPWSIDWLPDRTMLVTNRPGYLSVFRNGQALPQVANLPTSIEQGQGGLMEVAVHPNYARNGWIYLSYTEPAKDRQNAGMTKIVRGKLTWSGNQATWGNQQTIWEAEQEFYTRSGVHFGSKIVFDGKGHIFFTVGERGGNELAQNLASPFGKNYRLNEDGSIPQGNPFTANQGDGKKHVAGIWSIGHRNQQGLALDLNGNLWVTEHGPRGGDELNLIEKGANYGWPTYAFSIQYNGTPLATPWPPEDAKITLPLHRWIRSTGASGLDTVTGNAFPNWKGDLLAGGLAGQNVDRFRIKDGKIVEHEELIWNQGRIRDVRIGSDGNIYLAVNGPDMIVRMVPVN